MDPNFVRDSRRLAERLLVPTDKPGAPPGDAGSRVRRVR